MLKKKCRQFTLIEMLVVITIIALIAGVVGINSQKALNEQRFQSEVATLVDRLRLAQDLMLLVDADVHFKIEANENAIKYWIETEKQFSPQFDTFIKKVSVLKAIHHVAHPLGKDGVIDLKFLSKGSVISSGNLQLSTVYNSDNFLIANIPLNGHPSPISSILKKKDDDLSELLMADTHLTHSTIQEIQMVNHAKN